MDTRYSREGKMKKKTKMRRICPLCNELCLNEKDQIMHYAGALHKYMKRTKRTQYSYTKNLKSLDEKIKASDGQNEPLVGLEYIYQYAADKRGVIPYVCMLCDCVYKLDTIFFHIVGIKHRCLYLNKNFPAMGIDRNFRVKTTSDFKKLHHAVAIIEKSHGRRMINVSNSFFNSKKNSGMTYDSESGGEYLSSSEDEQDNPDSNSTSSKAKPLHTNEWPMLRSGVGDQKGDLPFKRDQYDGRRGQDGHSDMNRPLRSHGDSGFQYDSRSDHHNREDNHSLPMELSYQQRDPDSRKFTDRTDFPGDRHSSYQMHRSETAFQYDDRQGPTFEGGPRRTGIDRDFGFPPDQSTQSLGNPRGDSGLPFREPSHGDRSLQSQMHRGGAAFEYNDRQEPTLEGGLWNTDRQLRNNDRDFALQRDQIMGDHDTPSMGPIRQQVDRDGFKGQNRTSSHPLNYPGDRDKDRQGSMIQGGPRHPDNQDWKNDREFSFQPDQSIRSLDNPRGDFDMPSMGSLRQQINRDGYKGQDKTPNQPLNFLGDRDPSFQMHRDEMAFQRDDRRGGLKDSDIQLRNNERDFAFQRDESKRLLSDPHRDLNLPSMGPLHQQVGSSDFESQGRTQNHPSDFHSDQNFNTPMHRDRTGFQYDRPGPKLQGGPRHTDNRVRNDGRDFAFRQSEQLHGDPDMSSMEPSHRQAERDDLKGHNRTQSHPGFSGDRSSRMHRDERAFQSDDRGAPTLQGGPRHASNQVRNQDRDTGFRHDQSRRSEGDFDMPSKEGQKRTQSHSSGFPGDLLSQRHRGETSFHYDDIQPQDSAFQPDLRRERLFPDVHGDRDVPSKPFYQQRDHQAFEERNITENRRPGFSGDHSLHSQDHRGGIMHDGRSRDVLTFQEIKAAHEAGLDLGYGGMDEQGVEDDSDMEVRSMDLSDCDPDEFLCNADLFEFLKTFQISSSEDEQFVLKVSNFFTNSTIRYENHKEDVFKKRMSDAKERLEVEKAFLEVQYSNERPKKEHPQSATTAPHRYQAPYPSSSSIPPFPITTSSNMGQANRPIPLMSLVIDSIQPPGAADELQLSSSSSGQRGSVAEPRPSDMPTVNELPKRRNRWDQESIQTSEMHLEERSHHLSQREEFYPSRERSDDSRNFPSRFPPHRSSMQY